MIVAETPVGYRFVTQPAHAVLAGTFAARWGGEGFDPPEPAAAVILAATAHDDGWLPYDRRPRLSADGTPETFTELTPEAWIPLYDRGVEQVTAIDRYAGLLVSLHGTGLRRRRYGLSPDWPDTPPAFADFVDRHEARQREFLAALIDDADDRIAPADEALLQGLHETGRPPTDTASPLWTNYRLLQAWDTLSLACCTTASPPGRTAIEHVPAAGGDPTTLALSAGPDGAITIDPYPFADAPLETCVPARTVERAAFDREDGLVAAYHAADRESISLAFRPSD